MQDEGAPRIEERAREGRDHSFKRQAIDSLARSLFVPGTHVRLYAYMPRDTHPHISKEQKDERGDMALNIAN